MSQNKDEGFISHLTELRKRLIQSFVCLLVLFVICYIFSEEIYNFLVAPYAEAVKNSEIQRRLIFTALQETFLTYIKVSFFTAFFFTSPFILIQIWKFIAPGLYEHEKSAIMPYLVVTPILFLFSMSTTAKQFLDALNYVIFGTVDLLALFKERYHIVMVDYKFGRGDVDDADVNIQGQAYATAAMQKYPWAQTIEVHFILPRRNETTTHTYTPLLLVILSRLPRTPHIFTPAHTHSHSHSH